MARSDGWVNVLKDTQGRHDAVEYYKQKAKQIKAQKKYTQDFANILYGRMLKYIDECADKGEPLTFSGIQLAVKLPKDQWKKMRNGDYDWEFSSFLDINDITADDIYYEDDIPYTDKTGEKVILVPFSEIIEWVYLRVEKETEVRLYKNGRSGDIFALKAKHNWQEADKQPQTVNQTLVIASEEQARKAIEMLK